MYVSVMQYDVTVQNVSIHRKKRNSRAPDALGRMNAHLTHCFARCSAVCFSAPVRVARRSRWLSPDLDSDTHKQNERGGGMVWERAQRGQDSFSLSFSGAFKRKLCVLFFKFTLVPPRLFSRLSRVYFDSAEFAEDAHADKWTGLLNSS